MTLTPCDKPDFNLHGIKSEDVAIPKTRLRYAQSPKAYIDKMLQKSQAKFDSATRPEGT
jgi:hypothetical protein